MDFTDILKQGKKRYNIMGSKRGEHDKCDYCEERK